MKQQQELELEFVPSPLDALVMRIKERLKGLNIYDFKEGDMVYDLWFGTVETFTVIGHDDSTNQVQIEHLSTGGNGSYFIKPERLIIIDECKDDLDWLFDEAPKTIDLTDSN